MRILIVRLGALGDIVHAVPAAAALRAAFPDARIDWLVDAKHRGLVDMVTAVDRAVPLESPTVRGWMEVVGRLRPHRYDVALDLQGLLKSAVLARASGARRVLGFSIWHLREKTARPFYSKTLSAEGGHVVHKNLRLLALLGVHDEQLRFPLAEVRSAALDTVRQEIGSGGFALLNPGAAWPNKRWPAERFGEVASFLKDVRGLRSVVLWGPNERELAEAVAAAAPGAARPAPATGLGDLLALSRAASLMVSGDTGPLHIAAAAGTPIVAIFGPTDAARNGPWSADDIVISRYASCGCHYQRRCRRAAWCLAEIGVAEVTAAIQRRLAPSDRGVHLRMDPDREPR